MKKTPEEIEKLRQNLPNNYLNTVQSNLSKKGYQYSIDLIKRVVSGDRDNVIIELELTNLALENSKLQDKIKENYKKLK